MVAAALPSDVVFFDEWSRFRGVARRSVARASMFADALGVRLSDFPALVVVGSKGKATAATYASAVLAGAGLRVGTITSPPVITNRERIRIDGAAVDEGQYASIAALARKAQRELPPPTAATGYLSPVGMYLIAGLRFLEQTGCEVFVVEAGMGGGSDEVSLLAPRVLAVTPIFAEHLGILGDTIAAVAEEKLSIARHARLVVSAPQSAEVVRVCERIGVAAVIATVESSGVDCALLPRGLAAVSAAVGVVAARTCSAAGSDEAIRRVLATIHLPGRLTEAIDSAGRFWLADAAIDVCGVEEAVRYAEQVSGRLDLVFVSLPDGKDIDRTARWLDEHVGASRWLPVIPQSAAHLRYSSSDWRRPLVAWEEVVERDLPDRGTIVATGSWSFMSDVLARLGVSNERAFVSSLPAKEA